MLAKGNQIGFNPFFSQIESTKALSASGPSNYNATKLLDVVIIAGTIGCLMKNLFDLNQTQFTMPQQGEYPPWEELAESQEQDAEIAETEATETVVEEQNSEAQELFATTEDDSNKPGQNELTVPVLVEDDLNCLQKTKMPRRQSQTMIPPSIGTIVVETEDKGLEDGGLVESQEQDAEIQEPQDGEVEVVETEAVETGVVEKQDPEAQQLPDTTEDGAGQLLPLICYPQPPQNPEQKVVKLFNVHIKFTNGEGKDIQVPALQDSPGCLDFYAFLNKSDTITRDSIEEVIVPEGVNKINNSAFHACPNLKKVILPETLEQIGEDVFCGCTNLKEIKIPNNVRVIGADAFWGSVITTIVLPENFVEFGQNSLKGISKIIIRHKHQLYNLGLLEPPQIQQPLPRKTKGLTRMQTRDFNDLNLKKESKRESLSMALGWDDRSSSFAERKTRHCTVEFCEGGTVATFEYNPEKRKWEKQGLLKTIDSAVEVIGSKVSRVWDGLGALLSRTN
jgi:hypothetical protein